jgi:hypothetical protein
MNDLKKVAHGILWMAAACLCASPLAAQQEGGDKPKPAAYQYSLLLNTVDNPQDPDQQTQSVQPDSRPLSGVQNPTIGTPGIRHSYWVPGIQYSNTARSSSLNSAANSGWNTTSFVSTDLSLLEAWSHSTLSANYSGGGFFSTDKVQGNGQYQQLAANYEIDGRRWQVLFVDEFSYLPESSFGFGGPSALSAPGISGSLAVPVAGLQTGYVPNQTVLAAIGPRYSNSSAVQLTYRVSARGSVTLAGVYEMLRFVNPGNVNSDTEMLNAGYDYAVTRRDSIGFVYRFGAYRYPGDPQALGDHVVQFEYGRKITGRMALKLVGGPEFTGFRVPIGTLRERISGSGSGSLTYAFATSTNIELHYIHGVSGGSGVFNGASSDQVGASLSRQLARVWNGNMNFGYAKNRQIASASGSPTFNTWVVGAGLSRALGHVANISFGYQAQIQGASAAAASSNYTAHQVVMSFQWHTRPFVLR